MNWSNESASRSGHETQHQLDTEEDKREKSRAIGAACVVGLITLPITIVVAPVTAGCAAFMTTREGLVGDIFRATGDTAIAAREKILEGNDQYNITGRIKMAITQAFEDIRDEKNRERFKERFMDRIEKALHRIEGIAIVEILFCHRQSKEYGDDVSHEGIGSQRQISTSAKTPKDETTSLLRCPSDEYGEDDIRHRGRRLKYQTSTSAKYHNVHHREKEAKEQTSTSAEIPRDYTTSLIISVLPEDTNGYEARLNSNESIDDSVRHGGGSTQHQASTSTSTSTSIEIPKDETTSLIISVLTEDVNGYEARLSVNESIDDSVHHGGGNIQHRASTPAETPEDDSTSLIISVLPEDTNGYEARLNVNESIEEDPSWEGFTLISADTLPDRMGSFGT